MIEDPNFSLDLGHSWQEMLSDDAAHHTFYDAARDLGATLSAMPIDIAPDAMDQFAEVLVASRLNAEDDAARALDRRPTIYEAIVVPRPWGRAVAYFGHDDSGRQFGYAGMITPRCAISLYMSSDRLSEQELMEAMDEVGSKLEFDRTPLEALN